MSRCNILNIIREFGVLALIPDANCDFALYF